MSWDCCNIKGECQHGPGCPAGGKVATLIRVNGTAGLPANQICPPGMCSSMPGCKDHQCPAHPLLSGPFVGVKTSPRVGVQASGKNGRDVARIKSRMPRHPQAAEASWRQFLPDLIRNLLVCLGVLIFGSMVIWSAIDLFIL